MRNTTIRIEDLSGKTAEFAIACFDTNSIAELTEALKSGVDATDCESWSINEAEWFDAINAALNARI